MKKLLNLSTPEYEQANRDFLKLFPELKVKLRDQLCLTGQKYDYIQLSKVDINDSMKLIPSIFNEDKSNCTEIDCIGLYTVGIMEILYLILIKDVNLLSNTVSSLYKILNIFEDYRDVSRILDQLDFVEKNEINKDYYEAFNLAFTLKSNYNRTGYNMVKEYMSILLLIWLCDKQLYWQVFFEIMSFCKPILAIVMKDPIWTEFKQTHDDIAVRAIYTSGWINDEYDLKFEKISYKSPTSNNIRYISDTRGVAILLTLKFYLQFLSKYGTMNTKDEPYFNYKNQVYIDYLDTKIKNCIGNDSFSLAITGKHLDEYPQFSVNGSMVYNANNINTPKLSKLFYEDAILFSNAFLNNTDTNNTLIENYIHKDMATYYFNLDSLAHAVGSILYYSTELYGKAARKIEDQINKLINEISKVNKENDILRAKITKLTEFSSNINENEVNNLKNELNTLNEQIKSKQETIDKLVDKNKQLTSYIDNIYNEDDIDDEKIENDVTIEEMVNYINDFKFTLIGGRMDLVQKLNDIGWTNIIQFDHRNSNKLGGNISLSDFYVVNTKFISHKLVDKVETLDDITDTMIYFNGTNIDKLVYTCYQFVKNFLE